jgi:tetratricopeptide (TPR) repeat protein
MRTIKYVTFILGISFIAIFSACGDAEAPSAANETPAAPAVQPTTNPALAALNQKLSQTPDDPTLYYSRAEILYENNGFDEAITDLQQAIRLDSLQPDYFHLLADVYLDYFKSRLALATMEDAARRFPERIPTLLKLSEFQHILTKYEESMKTIDKVLKVDPQNAEAFFMFGLNFRETADTNRAINSFQKAVSFEPELVDAWINLGQLYGARDNKLAGTFFDNAIEVAPENIIALHAKANYLSDQDDLSGAIELYKKINTLDPQYDEAFFNTGLLYLDLDSIDQAYQHFDMALKVSPTFIMAYYYRGVASEMKGNVAKAKKDYEQALRMAPNYENARQAVDRLNREAVQ